MLACFFLPRDAGQRTTCLQWMLCCGIYEAVTVIVCNSFCAILLCATHCVELLHRLESCRYTIYQCMW